MIFLWWIGVKVILYITEKSRRSWIFLWGRKESHMYCTVHILLKCQWVTRIWLSFHPINDYSLRFQLFRNGTSNVQYTGRSLNWLRKNEKILLFPLVLYVILFLRPLPASWTSRPLSLWSLQPLVLLAILYILLAELKSVHANFNS